MSRAASHHEQGDRSPAGKDARAVFIFSGPAEYNELPCRKQRGIRPKPITIFENAVALETNVIGGKRSV